MANSSIIRLIKNKIIKEFIKDADIVQAIDSSQIDSLKPEKLINTHIFDYHQNPYTLNTVDTFITIQVHIPQVTASQVRFTNKCFVSPIIEIWIVSHQKHMIVNNVPKITSNRNDYLSELIDKKLNGRSGFGIGKLELTSNIEGNYQADYLYRKLTFQATDLNNSLCEDEETGGI